MEYKIDAKTSTWSLTDCYIIENEFKSGYVKLEYTENGETRILFINVDDLKRVIKIVK